MDLSTVKRKSWIFPLCLLLRQNPPELRACFQGVATVRAVIAGISLAALAGCASTQTILADAPDDVFPSAKSAEAVAFCVGEKNNAPPFKREDGSYVISIKSAVGMTGIVYTVVPDGAGSKIEVRRANSPISVTKFKNCL